MIKNILHIISVLFVFAFISSCKENQVIDNSQEEIVVRLESAPESLSPIIETTTLSTQVNEFMFVSLGDYDPVTLELIPVLIRDIPTAQKIMEGPYTGGDAFTMQIKEGAKWVDGSDITGYDVLFTYKMAAHPDVLSPGWKALMEDVYHVEVDKVDPSKFTIFTSGSYFLNLEVVLSAEIYPQYLYPGSKAIDKLSLAEVKEISTDDLAAQYPEISQLGKDFSSVKYNKEVVEGAGPYELSEWSSEEYLVLSKKEDYWGNQYPENRYLQGNFERIIFQIVPDETVALTLLKNDEIDILGLVKSPFIVFQELEQTDNDDIATYTSNSTRNNMILLNNQNEVLKDKKVREAIVLITDVDRMNKQLEGGLAKRTNSIINPKNPMYKKDLPMPAFSIENARAILDEAGWKDTNGNQIRDKVINGTLRELTLDFLITASPASAGISSIMVQSAKEAGVEIKPIINEKFSVILNEHLRTGDYDMSVYASIGSIASDDPFGSWHSSSIGVEGRNFAGYNNPEADKVIEKIRDLDITTEERNQAYYELQDIMSKDFPVIFLYSPSYQYAIDDDIDPVISLKRPGVFVNAFKMK